MNVTAEQLPVNGFAPIAAVCKLTTKSKPTIYRWAREGIFPKPVRLGPNSVAWRADDLRQWAENPTGWQAGAAR